MKKVIFLAIAVSGLIFPVIAQKTIQSKNESHTVLTQWMVLQSRLVRNSSGIPHVAYSRHFCYTAIAAYESIVRGKNEYRSLAGQLTGLDQLTSPPKGEVYWPASLNAAYAAMLRYFYAPFASCAAVIDSMQQSQEQLQLRYSDKETVKKSEEYGEQIAAAVIEWSKTDGSDNTRSYILQESEGLWIPTPPSYVPASTPYWGENRSLTKDLLIEVGLLKQPIYSTDPNSDFYKMANEVFTVSKHLTPEQKATAFYWDDSPNGIYKTVYGHWTSLLSGLVKQHDLSLIKTAEAFAKMAMSMYEAAILAWDGKYKYNVVRPVTYIQQHIDNQWTPAIVTPPHPEFPAAHATLSNAAATALCSLFGDNCSVTDASYTDIGLKERTYRSLQDVAKEAGMSRLYGGIHYRYSIEQGSKLGERAAKHVDANVSFRTSKKMAAL
jgi:hypothetical protein